MFKANNFENFEELFGKGKKKGKLGSKLKGIKEKIKDGIDKVKSKGKDAALIPLLPLKNPMKKYLKKKGIKHGKSLRDIAEKFYQSVILKKEKFESLDPITIGIVVKAILEYFKNLIDKKTSGEELPPEEQSLIVEGEKSLKDFDPDVDIDQDEADEEADVTGDSSSPMKMDSTMILILVAIAFLIFKGK